jgi:hypothetical protein
MKHIILSICIFLFFFSGSTLGQPYIELVNIRYYEMPEQSKLVNNGKTSNNRWITAGIQLPLKLQKDYLIISPFFEKYSIESEVGQNLYGISLSLAYLKQWKNKSWKTAFAFIPRISSDFKNVSSNDYQLGSAVVAVYQKKENLSYKFGAYYNSEYFGFFMLPLFGVEWEINDRLEISGVLPAHVNLEYKTGKHIYTGVDLLFITNSFRLYNDYYYRIDDNHLKLYADFYLTNNLVLTAEAGHSVLRKYTLGIRNDGVNSKANLTYENGFVFGGRISWRIRFDGKKTE